VACAAAVATTSYIVSQDVVANVNERSKQLFEGLLKIQADVKNGGWLIAEVRGVGVSLIKRPLLYLLLSTDVFFSPIFIWPHLAHGCFGIP
jgi:hypothetical protein